MCTSLYIFTNFICLVINIIIRGVLLPQLNIDPKICKYYCYLNTRSLRKINHDKLDKIKLVVFDMDGVLVDAVSSWKYIHDHFNTSNEKSVDDYVHGKIDDLEFIRRDVELWKINGKPIKMNKLEEILSDVPLMKGAEDLKSK